MEKKQLIIPISAKEGSKFKAIKLQILCLRFMYAPVTVGHKTYEMAIHLWANPFTLCYRSGSFELFCRLSIGVFPEWNRNSLNSANSGNPINHWSIHELSILVSYTRCGWVADLSPFTVMKNMFVTEFAEFSIKWKLNWSFNFCGLEIIL